MDFAKSQLTKFGWEEGKGLGRNESGITEALKPKFKFDTAGIGHDRAETFTHYWWEHSFNAAAKNINVCQTEDGVTLKAEDDFEITTRKVSSKQRKALLFNNFMKGATMTNEGTVEVDRDSQENLKSLEDVSAVNHPPLTDEELFLACGGRTAHKGARHGLGLNGKLARIEAQERQLLMNLAFPKEETLIEPTKKRKKSKQTSKDSVAECTVPNDEDTSQIVELSECKKRKKSRNCQNESSADICEDEVNVGEQSTPKRKKSESDILQTCLEDVEINGVHIKETLETSCPEIEQRERSKRKKKKSKKMEKDSFLEDGEELSVSTKRKRKKFKCEETENNVITHDSEQFDLVDEPSEKSGKRKKKKKRIASTVDTVDDTECTEMQISGSIVDEPLGECKPSSDSSEKRRKKKRKRHLSDTQTEGEVINGTILVVDHGSR